MSNDLELFHYGVKGMRWGVRRKLGPDGEVVGPPPGSKKAAKTEKKVARADQKFEKKASSRDVFVKIHNDAAGHLNNVVLPKLNSKPEYVKAAERGDLLKDTAVRRKYYREYETEFLKTLNDSAAKLGTNSSGTRRYAVKADASGNWSVQTDEIKHALTTAYKVRLKTDSKGVITGLEIVEGSMSHSDMSSKDLQLFGV